MKNLINNEDFNKQNENLKNFLSEMNENFDEQTEEIKNKKF